MAPESKIARLLEDYRGLNDEDKDIFINEIVQDKDLLQRLLRTLRESTDLMNEIEITESQGFVDFLKRVKE